MDALDFTGLRGVPDFMLSAEFFLEHLD